MHNESTIFLVDDDLSVLKSIRWLLESAGYSVETYSSATAFLAAFDANQVGCIILDLKMADIDGLELQRRLNLLGDHPPIIFVTGYGDVLQCAEAMKAGAMDFLEKPIQDHLILEQVERALAIDQRRWAQNVHRTEIDERLQRLSPREREVMELLLAGNPMKSISSQLGICIQTVAKHRTRVLRKLNVGGDAELARLMTTHQRPLIDD